MLKDFLKRYLNDNWNSLRVKNTADAIKYFENKTKDNLKIISRNMDELNEYKEEKIKKMIGYYINLDNDMIIESIPSLLEEMGLELICIVHTSPKYEKYCIRKISSKEIVNYFTIGYKY